MSIDLIKHTTTSTVIIDDVEIPVEIPSNPAQGLSGRDELTIGTGMLFDLDGHPVITMRGMKFSLDIIWISDDKKVVDISRNTLVSVLGNDTLYTPEKSARYALEINAGEAQKRGIKVGQDVEINLLPNSDLTRLLVLEEILEHMLKAVPGEKLEYLKPGEKAPRGIQVQRGARGGRGYYPSEVRELKEEADVLEAPKEQEIEVVQAPKAEPEEDKWAAWRKKTEEFVQGLLDPESGTGFFGNFKTKEVRIPWTDDRMQKNPEGHRKIVSITGKQVDLLLNNVNKLYNSKYQTKTGIRGHTDHDGITNFAWSGDLFGGNENLRLNLMVRPNGSANLELLDLNRQKIDKKAVEQAKDDDSLTEYFGGESFQALTNNWMQEKMAQDPNLFARPDWTNQLIEYLKSKQTKPIPREFEDGLGNLKEHFDIQKSDLSKLLVLETALAHLLKQTQYPVSSSKREYLAPGEKAPEGVQEQKGSRGGRYYELEPISDTSPSAPPAADSQAFREWWDAAVNRAQQDMIPEEGRELEVVSPDTDSSQEEQEQDVRSARLPMGTPLEVNNYFDGLSDQLDEKLKEIVGDNYKPFLSTAIDSYSFNSDLNADHITTAGYTDGGKEGAPRPTGIGINSMQNFTVTVDGHQFIYKMSVGENRGELLSYAIDRVLGLNIVPFVKQHSIDVDQLNSQIDQTHEAPHAIKEDFILELLESGVGHRAAGHFQEFCDNCVNHNDQPEVMASMLTTEKGREEFFKIMLLDVLTGNDDRHTGNYLITEDERIVAIDNGFAGGGEAHTPHQEQSPLQINVDHSRPFDISFPYHLYDAVREAFSDKDIPTSQSLKKEADTVFDKYFDKDKLDDVLALTNWTLDFRQGPRHRDQKAEDSDQTRSEFKELFVKNSAEYMFRAFRDIDMDFDSYPMDSPFTEISSLKFSDDVKRELADEGINVDVIHSLGFDNNAMVDESEPNIYEEDEFN